MTNIDKKITEKDMRVECHEKCKDCNGTGKEICNNPDHTLLNALSFQGANESACPCCGHDDLHRTKYDCEKCKGTGFISNPQPTQNWEVDFDSYFGKDQYGGVVSFRQDNVKSFIKSILENKEKEVRIQTIEECIEKIPEFRDSDLARIDKLLGSNLDGWNECRTEAIQELNKLKDEK